MPQVIGPVSAAFEWIAATYEAIGPIWQAVVNVALSAGTSAIVANNSKPKEQGNPITLQLDPSAPRRLQLGQRLNGGLLVDWYLSGTKNTKLHMPVYLSEGPCGRVLRIFGGGRVVHDTPLVHGVKQEITAYRSGQDGDPGPRLWVTYYDGRPGQEAPADLVALNQGWTTDDKLTGCAWVLVEAWWDSDNQRSPPQLTFECEGAKLYDRRKDATAGGSGSHRIDNPATWELSAGDEGANPMVAIDHFVLGRYWNGKRVFGIGQSADDVPYTNMAHHANISDEDVDKKEGGTQKRYRANGFIFANDDHDTTIKKLAAQMVCSAADLGGRFAITGIEARTPVMTIDDSDLIDGLGDSYSPKRPWSDLFSGVEGRFNDKNNLYQPIDYPRVSDAVWIAEDGNEARYATRNFEFEIDGERAQRLARLNGQALRRQGSLTGAYPIWTCELERGDWFIRTGRRWGEDGKIFEVLDRAINVESGLVTIVANEVDPDDSAWDEALARDPPTTPTPGVGSILAIEQPTIVAVAISLTGTTFAKPAVRVQWTAPTDPRVKSIYIEIWPTADQTRKTAQTVAIPNADNYAIFDQGIVDGVEYTVRARFLTAQGIPSKWSSTTTVTPVDPFVFGGLELDDIVNGINVNAEDILRQTLLLATWQAAQEALLWIDGESVGQVATESRTVAEGFAGDISLLGARNGMGTAFVLDLDTVQLPPDGLGSTKSLRTLRSEHDGHEAAVNFLLETVGTDYAGVVLSTSVDGYVTGLRFWNGGSYTTSGFVIMSPNFAIIDPANGVTSAFIPFSISGGVVRMHNVEIDTLAVDSIVTEHLQDNSVSDTLVATDSTTQTVPSNATFVQVFSANFESVTTTLRIDLLTQCRRNNGDRCRIETKLFRDGSLLFQRYNSSFFPNWDTTPADEKNTFVISDNTPGVHTWTVEIRILDGNGGVSGWTKSLAQAIFTEIKK